MAGPWSNYPVTTATDISALTYCKQLVEAYNERAIAVGFPALTVPDATWTDMHSAADYVGNPADWPVAKSFNWKYFQHKIENLVVLFLNSYDNSGMWDGESWTNISAQKYTWAEMKTAVLGGNGWTRKYYDVGDTLQTAYGRARKPTLNGAFWEVDLLATHLFNDCRLVLNELLWTWIGMDYETNYDEDTQAYWYTEFRGASYTGGADWATNDAQVATDYAADSWAYLGTEAPYAESFKEYSGGRSQDLKRVRGKPAFDPDILPSHVTPELNYINYTEHLGGGDNDEYSAQPPSPETVAEDKHKIWLTEEPNEVGGEIIASAWLGKGVQPLHASDPPIGPPNENARKGWWCGLDVASGDIVVDWGGPNGFTYV